MVLIAAVDAAWGIGKDGDLLKRISADMKFFRSKTQDHVLIIGRKTLESFPNQKPLPRRTHFVLSANPAFGAEGVTVCRDIPSLLQAVSDYPPEEVFVAGGGSIYRQLLPECTAAWITKIDAVFPADTYFPDLDSDPDWALTSQGDWQEEDGIRFCFCRYEKMPTKGEDAE